MTRRRGEDGDAMELSVLDEGRWGAGEHTGHWWAQARDIRERVLRLPFLRQLVSSYEALLRNERLDPAPASAATYADFIAWERQMLSGPAAAPSQRPPWV